PAAAVLRGPGDRCLQVVEGDRDAVADRVVDGTGGVGVLGRDPLGVRRSGTVAGDVDAASGPAGAVAAVMHDLLSGGVVRAVRVGHGDRVEPVVDQVLAVGADLVDLGLVVGGGLEVGVVERVAFEVLAVVGHRGELG